MNFLKKKIKTVVHGGKRNKDDDDDDFDNYVPEVPPHPSTLTDPNGGFIQSLNASDTQFASFSTANFGSTPPLAIDQSEQESAESNEPKLSLEELKALEEEHKRVEKEKLKQQEDSKKDCEEWKYFLSLTAKVDAVTSKTQTTLTKLKDESAVNEINKFEDICYSDKFDRNAPKGAGGWVAFGEQEEFNPADPFLKQPAEEPPAEPPVLDEAAQKIARELIDDFGFTNPALGIAVPSENVDLFATEAEVDPFDTSFIDIETIKSGGTVKPAELIRNLDSKDEEFDPFDTSHIEAAVTNSLVLENDDDDKNDVHEDEDVKAEAMSNPFLADLDDSYTPYGSGVSTPFSGAATPKRRNSTNPFEVLSPDSEEPIFFVPEGSEVNNNNKNETNENVASAIADMTADFYQTINKFDFDTTINDDVFDDRSGKTNEDANANNEDQKPVKTVTTITTDNNGCVFDPFETIHDDDPALSSKRSSIEHTSTTNTTTVKEEEQSSTTHLLTRNSSKAKELFNSSMASFELLAASGGGGNTQDEQFSDYSPMSPMTPPLSNCENNAFLSAPQGMEIYSSETSDISDVSATVEPEVEVVPINVGSAFDDQPEESNRPKIMDMDDIDIIKHDESFDIEQPIEPSEPETKNVEQEWKEQKPKSIDHSKLESITGCSIDIYDVGNPNLDAEGIINDAFDEIDKQDDKVVLARKDSVEVTEVESSYIQPNDLRELVEPIEEMEISAEPSDICIEISENKAGGDDDPFDTSAFDSKAFDELESRFEATETGETGGSIGVDPFASPYHSAKVPINVDDDNNEFDSFEPFVPKQPENTPYKVPKPKKDSFEDSDYSDDSEDENIKIVIKAKMKDPGQSSLNTIAPLLPPPPKSPRKVPQQLQEDEQKENDEEEEEPLNEEDKILMGYKTPSGKKKKGTAKTFLDDEFDRFFSNTENRTDGSETTATTAEDETEWPTAFGEAASKRSTTGGGGGDSPASPQTPLYDEDTSQPLEEFPARYYGDGWEMMLRHPAKKKLTANRYWKKIFVRFVSDTCVLQLYNKKEDTTPFQELPLQASYSISEICAQQFDQYGKIFTIKVQYIFYRERVGVRPGQIAKVMQGQIQSMGDFARLGMPVEHAPQVSELLKIGTLEYSDLKEFVQVVEESMFRMSVHRDRALTYRTEEIQCVVQDELYVEQNKMGIVEKQLARVRVFFLAFLNGVPALEVGVNDLRRQGKEVVGRHDILPVVTEEWIRVEAPEFHSCVQSDVFDTTQVVKLIPPDACHFELMRFRIRPPKNRELPLQVTGHMNITPTKMELKCDILVPGCISRKHGQIPCEEIQIRFHIPECWIYFFRVEKHFRMGAVHSTNRRSGKLKGLDRILGTATNPEPQLIEVTAGQAKYEHAFHSIVWRIPRLPKDGQGAYTQQLMLVRLPLSSFDRIPETFYDYVHVEFHMPSTTVSHTTLRSISVNSENPPEKFVRYIAKYEYKIGLNITYDDTKPELDYVASAIINNGSVKNSGEQDTAHSSDDEADD